MKKHRYSRSRTKKEKSFIVSVFSGALCSLLFGVLLTALFALPALKLEDPLRFAPVFGLASLFISAAVGAHLSARLHGKSGLACGMLSSLLLILVLVGLSFVFSVQIKPSLFSICAPSLLLLSAVSGILGVTHA
ncbi:MAG: TIGR04086 family membrane protein [Clostridia bacterium]|nr:TIGR04086 family membrane protein [Clostridia bacterium]